jgi:hypothetical protein
MSLIPIKLLNSTALEVRDPSVIRFAAEGVFYLIFAMVIGLVIINAIIIISASSGFPGIAKYLQNILDKVAWPLRLG